MLRASSNQPGPRGGKPHMRPLFGLAPGGVCRAVPVTGNAVGSYPTLSPWPAVAFGYGGQARCSFSESGWFAFCGTFPDPGSSPGPPGVTRHRLSVEPGLSSPHRNAPRPPDPLARTGIAFATPVHNSTPVIASEAKQSILTDQSNGLLRRLRLLAMPEPRVSHPPAVWGAGGRAGSCGFRRRSCRRSVRGGSGAGRPWSRPSGR